MNIPYRIKEIQTLQFAMFPKVYNSDTKTDVQTEFKFFVHKDMLELICISDIYYYQSDKMVLYAQVQCGFSIDGEAAQKLKADNRIPSDFLRYIATITIGAARGIISAKTENTVLHAVVLPPINLVEMPIEDIVLNHEKIIGDEKDTEHK